MAQPLDVITRCRGVFYLTDWKFCANIVDCCSTATSEMPMPNSFSQLLLFAPFVCNTHLCRNHRQTIDVAAFTVDDERAIYGCPNEDSTDYQQCLGCGIFQYLSDPYGFLGFFTKVDETSVYMLFEFDADDIDNIRTIYKNTIEDMNGGERVLLATDEAFKFDNKFEVWDCEIFRPNNHGNLEMPKRSPLPNRNKVLIVSKDGVRFQSDAEVVGRTLVVSSPLFTLADMDAWYERLRYTAHKSKVDVVDGEDDADLPF